MELKVQQLYNLFVHTINKDVPDTGVVISISLAFSAAPILLRGMILAKYVLYGSNPIMDTLLYIEVTLTSS